MSFPPYLKNKIRKTEGSSMVVHRPSDNPEDDNADAPMHAAAEDIIRAVQASDSHALASALQAAFQIMDAAPHEEYHDEEDSE